ncbi:MAG: PAS domain S-box protein [Bacteroidota bacterium]|nr:PAS domain S-box protein [Bacteroidota bacterium]MDP4195843.1 PAS domain S-box protein [Bacteroidota bacterium]
MLDKNGYNLRNDHYLLENLFDTSDIYMCIVEWIGTDFLLLLPNSKFAEFFNKDIAELKNRKVSELGLPESTFNYWLNVFSVCDQINEKFPLEFSFTDNGAERWFKGTLVPIKKISDSENRKFNLSAFEVTEYKEIEEAFKLSEHRYKSLLQSVTDYIYTVKIENGEVVSTIHGPGCLAVTGFSSEDYYHNPNLWNEMIYPEDRELVIELSRKVMEGENPPAIEHRIIHRDKNIRWLRNSLIARHDKNSKVVAYDGLISDITERKAMESLLSHERDLLHNLLNHIPDTIYFKDKQSRFTHINPAQAALLGISSTDEAIGKSDFEFFPVEHSQAAFEDEQRIMKTGKPLIDKLEYIRRSSGDYIWVSATKVPIIGKDGQINGIVGISRDMTERKKAEDVVQRYTKELEDLNASKDKLFSIIAHDLRSPFNGLLGFASILESELESLNDEEIKSFANNIKSSVQNILTLLNNLLEWAKIQIGVISPKAEVIKVHNKVNDIFALFEVNSSNKNIRLINDTDMNLSVKADGNMLSSVLQNLISNAIKFTKEFGEVRIITQISDQNVEIAVVDNGIGISEELLNRMFKIDSNLSTLGTKKEKGSGLGLIISKELIEKNNGSIYVESKPGFGSKFVIRLPSGE